MKTATKKRTARSASIPSTPAGQIRFWKKAYHDEQQECSSLAGRLGASNAKVESLRATIDGLKRHVTDLRLDIARHEGYVDRVREMDGQARVTRTRLSQAISRIAEEDLSAEQILHMSDADFAKLVDKASPALDRALGRDDIEEADDD